MEELEPLVIEELEPLVKEGMRVAAEHVAAVLPDDVEVRWEPFARSRYREFHLGVYCGERRASIASLSRAKLAQIGADEPGWNPKLGDVRPFLAYLQHRAKQTFAYEPPDPNERLLHAVRHTKPSSVRSALADGAQLDTINSALKIAAGRSDLESTRILIAAGAEVNHSEEELQWTPLGYAVRSGHAETVAFLLDAGADINVGSAIQTPYEIASERADRGEVRELLMALLRERGADTSLPPEGVLPRVWLQRCFRTTAELDACYDNYYTRCADEQFWRDYSETGTGIRIPFRQAFPRWAEIEREMQPGDEVWEYDNGGLPGWPELAYRFGYCVVRDRVPIAAMTVFRS